MEPGLAHSEAGSDGVNQFLTHLAVIRNVAASTQNQALSALLFLYTKVLKSELKLDAIRAKRSEAGRSLAWQYICPADRHWVDSQELLGHADVSTTMIYTHVGQLGACGVESPLDRL